MLVLIKCLCPALRTSAKVSLVSWWRLHISWNIDIKLTMKLFVVAIILYFVKIHGLWSCDKIANLLKAFSEVFKLSEDFSVL